jgi:2-(1,2-epoxy-1,2-dihydrophenyl)acetyl-CoA isomerase
VSDLLDLVVDGGVALVTLRRTDAANALNMDLKAALTAIIRDELADPSVRAVVVTGDGAAFCAGGDILEMELNTSPAVSRQRLSALLGGLFVPLAELEKPTIAAVNGHAHGAGLSLALACDLIYAAEDAMLSCAFTKIGLVPDCGALHFLPRRIGLSTAKELVFSGRRVDAVEALRLGLVDRVLSGDELIPAARETARQWAAGPTIALGMAKQLMNRSAEATLREMSELEAYAQAIAYATEDNKNARTAFIQRRPPVFLGR